MTFHRRHFLPAGTAGIAAMVGLPVNAQGPIVKAIGFTADS